MQSQIDKTKQENKSRAQNFQSIDTGVQNCLFIKTTIDDVLKLGTDIIRDLAETKVKKTKFTLRLLPIEIVCRANMEDIKNAAGELFDKHFLKEPSTFAIIFHKRYNQDIKRDDVIKELADLVAMKNPLNKVFLDEPQQSIIVEVIKGHCLITVVPDFHKLKRYNVNELWAKQEKETDAVPIKEEAEKEADSPANPTSDKKEEI